MNLHLSRAHFPIYTLGPGARLGIWFQGCSIRCPGCISQDTWDFKRGATTVSSLLEAIAPWVASAEGITISGGEPFDQEEALYALLGSLRGMTAVDVLVFSGNSWEYLAPKTGPGGRFEGLMDALITDPYLREVPQTMALRGSDNQRLHCLSPRGHEVFKGYDRQRTPVDHSLDLMMGEDGEVWMAGIPSHRELQKLSALLEAGGHSVVTSEKIDPGRKIPFTQFSQLDPQ